MRRRRGQDLEILRRAVRSRRSGETVDELDLSDTEITDKALANLKGLTELQTLRLGSVFREGLDITDEGVAHLTALTNLEELDLNSTDITDKALTMLKGLTKLRKLRLDGTQITDVGLNYLKELTNLQELNLSFTRVTTSGINDLKKALPKLKVYIAKRSLPPPTIENTPGGK